MTRLATNTASVTGDAVTAFRRELKYSFRSYDFHRIVAELDARCERIRFAGADVSAVSSIHFYDNHNGSVWESMSGIGNRIKLRLRWYESAFPNGRAVFEVKRHVGAAVVKDRSCIPLPAGAELPSDEALLRPDSD